MELTAERKQVLREIFDDIYDSFALDTREIANGYFDGDRTQAYRACKQLEDKRLITGTMVNASFGGRGRQSQRDNVGHNITWQTWQTYDEINRAEHDRIAVEAGL